MESWAVLEVGSCFGIERCEERSVFLNRSQSSALLRVVVFVAECALAEKLGIVVVAELLGEYRQSIVGEIIFQCVRYGVVARHVGSVVSERNIAFLNIWVDVRAHLVVFAW